MLSLVPLFPGTNEKDQVHKIHNILGTPPRRILDRFQKYATHIDFNFPHIVGTGISQLIPHISPESQDIICKLLTYDPDERITARQALNSACFKELRAQESKVSMYKELSGPTPTNAEEHAGEPQYFPKKPIKPAELPPDIAKKKVQQGSKKPGEHEGDQNAEYEDLVANNVGRMSNLW